jgi:glycosyltransferase involved in cell wall biosynthesis
LGFWEGCDLAGVAAKGGGIAWGDGVGPLTGLADLPRIVKSAERAERRLLLSLSPRIRRLSTLHRNAVLLSELLRPCCLLRQRGIGKLLMIQCGGEPMKISVVVPIYNERDNVLALYRQLKDVLERQYEGYEILFVDDGSNDGSWQRMKELAGADNHVKIVRFRRNYGQTPAMQAGLQMACGEIIVTMDGDLQNDPADIPKMVAKIDEGYDLVHGWRKHRKDRFLSRRLPSMIANWLISRTTRFPIHDLGCTLKAIRHDIAHELELYGEMHRFIPILAHQRGARCLEMVTTHHPRRFGQSKYGISRTLRVILDLMTVKYVLDYFPSPMRLFGSLGIFCGLIGGLAGATTIAMKLIGGVDMTGNPLLLLSIFSVMIALQFMSLGLLGEVSARIYYSNHEKQPFAVRELVNFPKQTAGSPDQIRVA